MVLSAIWQFLHLLNVITLKMFILHLIMNLWQDVMVIHSQMIQQCM